MDAFRAALVLTVKSMVLGTRWAGRQRRLWLETAWDAGGNEGLCANGSLFFRLRWSA